MVQMSLMHDCTFVSERLRVVTNLGPGDSPAHFYVGNRLGSADPPQQGTVATFDVRAHARNPIVARD